METKQIKIAETTFYINKLNAFDGLKTMAELQSDLTSSINIDINSTNIAQIISSALSSLDAQMIDKWCNKLLFSGHVNYGKDGETLELNKGSFDLVFSDFGEALELLCFVIMENFKDPLVRLLDRIGLGDLAETTKQKLENLG